MILMWETFFNLFSSAILIMGLAFEHEGQARPTPWAYKKSFS